MSDAPFTRRPARVSGLLLAGLAALLVSPAREARAQADEGMTVVADGGAATIDAFGVCRVVQNMTGLDVMVPHSIPEEWYTGGNSFLENVPENMSTSPCPTTIVGDCFDPRFVGQIGGPDWSGGICDGMLIVDNRMLAKAASPMSCQADDYQSTSLLLQMNFTTGNYVRFLPPKWPDVPLSPTSGVIFHSTTTDSPYLLEVMGGIIDPAPAPGGNRFVRYGQGQLNVALDIAGDPNTGGHLLSGNPINGSWSNISTSTMDFTSGGVILNYRLHNPVFPSGVTMPNGIEASAAFPEGDWCGDGSFAIPGPDGNTYSFEDSEFNIFTGQVTVMSELFRGTEFNGDIGYWYTSHALSLYGLFRDNPAFNQDISGWDVSNVRDLRYTFSGATAFDRPIGAWNVSNVMNTAGMFRGATSFNQPIGGWDTRSLSHMAEMFRNATAFNHPLNGWDLSGVRSLEGVFDGAAAYDQPLNAWDVSSVRTFDRLFRGATAFDGDVSAWDTRSAISLYQTFRDAGSFNQPIEGWDTSSVVSLLETFLGATAFNQPIGAWDVSNVEDMSFTFSGATAFNQDLNAWDVFQVRDMGYMFQGATSFNQDLNAWDVSNVEGMGYMFSGATAFNGNLSGWRLSKMDDGDLGFMFSDATSFSQNISSWCVYGAKKAPFRFAPTLSPMSAPRWGTCPTDPCNTATVSGATCLNGDIYAGNVGTRRLYVAPADEGSFAWLSSSAYIRSPAPNASSTSDGLTNQTNLLKKSSRDFLAAKACSDRGSKPSQWYLPSEGELLHLFENAEIIPGFGSSYWSSTTTFTEDPWFGTLTPAPRSVSLRFGLPRVNLYTTPGLPDRVRCVRR